MSAVNPEFLNELGRSRPEFFKWFDKDPERALRTFMELAYRYLMVSPPRAFLWFDESRRHDLAADVLIYLTEDDFRRLRAYQDQGRPFIGWLLRVAHNKAIDIWKREQKIRHGEGPTDELPDAPDPRPTNPIDKVMAERVRKVIFSFWGERCFRLLVWRLLFEYNNREMTAMEGWSADRNAEMGNLYRRCRLALIERLKESGIDRSVLTSFGT